MTTEQDDNLRHNLPHPDVMHGMWRKEPFSKVIPLSKDLREEFIKYNSREVDQRYYLKRLYEIKQNLNQEELLILKTMDLFASSELKEKTSLYLDRLKGQLVKVKDTIYSPSNRKVLNTLNTEQFSRDTVNAQSIFELQADEAIWLFSYPSIHRVKSKLANLIYDLQLLHSWTVQSGSKLENTILSDSSEAIEWWLLQLGLNKDASPCKQCEQFTFEQFPFCIHCLNVIKGERR